MTKLKHIFVGARFIDFSTLIPIQVVSIPDDPSLFYGVETLNKDPNERQFQRLNGSAFEGMVKVLPIEAIVGDTIVLLPNDWLKANAPEAIGVTVPVTHTKPGFVGVDLTLKDWHGTLFLEPHEYVVVAVPPGDDDADLVAYNHLDEVVHVNPLGDMPEFATLHGQGGDRPNLGEVGQVTGVLPTRHGYVNVVLARGDKHYLHASANYAYRPFFDAFAPLFDETNGAPDNTDDDVANLLKTLFGVLDIETALGVDPASDGFDKTVFSYALGGSPADELQMGVPTDLSDEERAEIAAALTDMFGEDITKKLMEEGSVALSPEDFAKTPAGKSLEFDADAPAPADEEPVNVSDLDFDVTASLVVPELLALLRAGKNDAQVLSKQINERVVSLRSSVGDVAAALSRTRTTPHLTLSLEETQRVFQGLDNLRNGIAVLETLRGNVSMIVDAFDSAAADVADLAARKSVEASNSTVNVFVNAPEDMSSEELMDAINAALDEGFGGYTEVSKSA